MNSYYIGSIYCNLWNIVCSQVHQNLVPQDKLPQYIYNFGPKNPVISNQCNTKLSEIF